MMEELKFDLFFETSAKTDMNIDKMFRESTETIIKMNLMKKRYEE